jgi:hypothetical protein
MIEISVEAHDLPIRYGGDGGAVRRTERAISAHGRRQLRKISHEILRIL